MKGVILAAIVGTVGLLTGTNEGNSLGVSCSRAPVRPLKPWCLQNLEKRVTDDFTFSRCFDELEHYGHQVEEYARCRGKDGDRVLQQYDSAVKEFNCFANGEVCRDDPVMR